MYRFPRVTSVVISTSLLLIFNSSNAQVDIVKEANHASTYISYYTVGLGSNMYRLQPCFRATGDRFAYTFEQSWVFPKSKNKQKPVVINFGVFKRSSADSILDLVKKLKDTLIYKTNPCVMSGGIDYLTIAYGNDTTKFTLFNTTDLIAINIITIINQYLPVNNKLPTSDEPIKRERECWKALDEENRKRQSKPISAYSTKNGS